MQYLVGNKRYELSGHTNNVLAVITDKKIPIEDGQNAGEVDYFEPELIASTDYSPFGVRLSDRNWNSSTYRSSFQGQEHDDEVKGEGRSVNYTYRMHSPDLGRFFAVDPLVSKYPWNSPYAFSENRVIDNIELEGLEGISAKYIGTVGLSVKFKKSTFLTVHVAAGAAASYGANNMEVNARLNIDMKLKDEGSGGYGINFKNSRFNLTGMYGVGDNNNMAGFGTVGFIKKDEFTMDDFSFSEVNPNPYSGGSGNTFKGIGYSYEGDFNKKTNPTQAIVFRVGTVSKNKDAVDVNYANSLRYSFSRSVTEFGVNGSHILGSGKFNIESSFLNTKMDVIGSNNFLAPTPEIKINSKSTYQFGASLDFNRGLSLTGGSGSIGKAGVGDNGRYIFNVSLNYDKDSGASIGAGSGSSTLKSPK